MGTARRPGSLPGGRTKARGAPKRSSQLVDYTKPSFNAAVYVPKNSRLFVSLRHVLRERLVRGYTDPMRMEAYYGTVGVFRGLFFVRIFGRPNDDIIVRDSSWSKRAIAHVNRTGDPLHVVGVDVSDQGTWVDSPSELGVDTRSIVTLSEASFSKWPPAMRVSLRTRSETAVRAMGDRRTRLHEARDTIHTPVLNLMPTLYVSMNYSGFISLIFDGSTTISWADYFDNDMMTNISGENDRFFIGATAGVISAWKNVVALSLDAIIEAADGVPARLIAPETGTGSSVAIVKFTKTIDPEHAKKIAPRLGRVLRRVVVRGEAETHKIMRAWEKIAAAELAQA